MYLRVIWEENSNSQGSPKNLEHQVKIRNWQLQWVWYGCQEMTLQALLEKLIPKVPQADDDPITEKKVRYIKDNDENRPWGLKYQNNWYCQILIVSQNQKLLREKRIKYLIENQCPDALGAKTNLPGSKWKRNHQVHYVITPLLVGTDVNREDKDDPEKRCADQESDDKYADFVEFLIYCHFWLPVLPILIFF